MKNLEEIEIFQDRMFSYRFLAQVYKTAPSETLLESLTTLDKNFETPLRKALDELREAELPIIKRELGAEYNRVFLNMGPDPLAPYESVYTSSEGLLMQDARDQVLALYRAESLAPTSDVNIPEDHIAIELEFMAYLCEKALYAANKEDAEAVAEYATKQKDFLKDHLLAWVPSLCTDMKKRVKTEFYQGICAMTQAQLELDAEWYEA